MHNQHTTSESSHGTPKLLNVCGAPMRGAPPAGTIYVEQHPDGSLTVDGVWQATVSRCVPVGMLIISLHEVEGTYWCFESDFTAAGFTVPATLKQQERSDDGPGNL